MTTMLTKIQIAGFRSLKDVELCPGRVTVLIGPNGSGKSNLLSLLRMVPRMKTQSLRRFVGYMGGAASLLHYGPKTTPQLSLRIEAKADDGRESAYAARLGYASGDAFIYLDETVESKDPSASEWQIDTLGAGHPESQLEPHAKNAKFNRAKVVKAWLERMNFFHFHDTSTQSPLRQHARQEETAYLRSDGVNLAAYLLALKTGQSESYAKAWQRITATVQQIAPYIKSLDPVLVDPSVPEQSAVRLDWTDDHDATFGVHQLSDGTLRAIALVTALAQPADRLPAFISIDEPELGLHPVAVTVLMSLIRSVASRCQVLLATQSPALLDLVEPDEVVVAERVEGETQLRRLDGQQLATWLDEYSLSELYDKNVLGGRP